MKDEELGMYQCRAAPRRKAASAFFSLDPVQLATPKVKSHEGEVSTVGQRVQLVIGVSPSPSLLDAPNHGMNIVPVE